MIFENRAKMSFTNYTLGAVEG